MLRADYGRLSGLGIPCSQTWPSRLTCRQQLWYYICEYVMGREMESAITVKGQATIPKPIREHLGLKPGDRIKFFVHPDGTVVMLPKLPVTALRGMLKSD